MMTLLGQFLLIVGALFILIAAIGVVRLPDLFCRMHAATKAGAFGTAVMLIGASLLLATPRAAIVALLIVLFFYLTAPVAAHMIGRAAYLRGVKLWEGTRIDEMAEREDRFR